MNNSRSRWSLLGFLLVAGVVLAGCMEWTQKIRLDEEGVPRSITIDLGIERETAEIIAPDVDPADPEERFILGIIRPELVTDEEFLAVAVDGIDPDMVETAETLGIQVVADRWQTETHVGTTIGMDLAETPAELAREMADWNVDVNTDGSILVEMLEPSETLASEPTEEDEMFTDLIDARVVFEMPHPIFDTNGVLVDDHTAEWDIVANPAGPFWVQTVNADGTPPETFAPNDSPEESTAQTECENTSGTWNTETEACTPESYVSGDETPDTTMSVTPVPADTTTPDTTTTVAETTTTDAPVDDPPETTTTQAPGALENENTGTGVPWFVIGGVALASPLILLLGIWIGRRGTPDTDTHEKK